MSNYLFDNIGGKEVPPLIIKGDYVLNGFHQGTVHVESGEFVLDGTLQGTLSVHSGATAIINGEQMGTVSVDNDATISVNGNILGTTNIAFNGTIIIENSGRVIGTNNNNGSLIIRGVFGGARSGNGKIIIEGNGYIKEPVIKNGIHYYE